MSGRYRLQKQTKKLNTIKQDEPLYIPGSLGLTIGGSQTVEVPSRPGFVYVRLRNDLSETVQAYNDKVSNVYGLPVIVTRDITNRSYYTIYAKDTGIYGNWGSTAYLPAHGAQHSFDPNSPGADPVWVWDNQIMQFAPIPSGSSGGLNLIIEPGVFYSDRYDRWIYCGSTGTPSFASYKPTGTSARSVLCYIDWNGNPKLAGGSHFTASQTGTSQVLSYLPVMPADIEIPICAVRLLSGTSSIVWDNIYNLRQFPEGYNLSGTGGSSGLSSGTLVANVIPYATDAGLFPTWNTDFTIDDRVGGGLSLILNGVRGIANESTLNLVAESGQGDSLSLWGYGQSQYVKFMRSAGSQASPSAVTSGTILGALDVLGYTTAGYYTYSAGMFFRAIQDHTDANAGSKISFYVSGLNKPYYYSTRPVLELFEHEARVTNYLWVGSGTSYATLDAQNALRLYGNATVFDDLTFDLTAGKQGALAKPDFDYNDLGYSFPQNDATEILYLVKQMPHNWKEGSNVEPHVHFRQTSSLWPVFKIDYRWYNIGADVPAGWTTLTFDTPKVTYVTGSIHQIADSSGTVSGAGKTLSSMFQVKLYRDDNVVTGDVLALQFDLHYEIDSLGSSSEYTK